MRISDLLPIAADAWQTAKTATSEILTPTVRLGVTGLSRAGKTVFITALVRNLVSGGRLPFFKPSAQGRILRAYLEPQPDDSVPRFAFETHLGALAADPPEWPESTRQISELRVTVDYQSNTLIDRALGTNRLHIDIVDYPGEWLIDLPLLEETFATWSRNALARTKDARHADAARPFLAFIADLPQTGIAETKTPKTEPRAETPESVAIRGAKLFTEYLATARASGRPMVQGPGRFLMPGELADSPLLTFFPLCEPLAGKVPHLANLLARRFESYKTRVVQPFFQDHFRRLDRQIVLVDALGAIDAGTDALADLEAALTAVLAAFRPGKSGWLASLLRGRRIDRILFAATKADHLHHTSHDRLEAILRLLVARASTRAEKAGAEIEVLALAALRATRETEARIGEERWPCVAGIPLPGETVDGKTFDGRKEAIIFPGDLPKDPSMIFASPGREAMARPVFPRFRPPRLTLGKPDGRIPATPHIRLDRALEFLFGDRLA